MISAYARAALALRRRAVRSAASRAAAFILERMRTPDGAFCGASRTAARHNAYLADYAFVIAGSSTCTRRRATPLASRVDRFDGVLAALRGSRRRRFFMTSDDHEELLAREKPATTAPSLRATRSPC